MKLARLIDETDGLEGIEVTGLALDSREVQPGYLFAALPGSRLNGRDFASEAVSRGAVAILTGPESISGIDDVPQLTDPNPRHRLARIAAKFYGPQPACIAAVTGTNGKTSVAHFVHQIWTRLGRRAAYIGTLGVDSSDMRVEHGLTTPDPITLQRTLSELAASGVTHAVLEASSHGLDQSRVDGAGITIAAFTNLSHEHLDYHATIESYFRSKARLFEEILSPAGTAVINVDSAEGRNLARIVRARGNRVLGVGKDAEEIKFRASSPEDAGCRIELEFHGEAFNIRFPLIGQFQASNAVLAAGIAIASGEDPQQVFASLESLQGVPGRLELAGLKPDGARVFIDYAHTPDGLENILSVAQSFTEGDVAVVFGCGGDRDPGKRRIMGEIAIRGAERVYVTDDNPRSERPAAIRAQVLEGAHGAREFDDRARAIRTAIDELGGRDTLLITGKGHETGQIVANETLPFDDFEVVRNHPQISAPGERS